jgi:hypothetical protein
MVFMKRGRGLLEKSLEDAREAVGHDAHRNAHFINANTS